MLTSHYNLVNRWCEYLTAPPISWLKGRLVAEEVGAAWGADKKTRNYWVKNISKSHICTKVQMSTDRKFPIRNKKL